MPSDQYEPTKLTQEDLRESKNLAVQQLVQNDFILLVDEETLQLSFNRLLHKIIKSITSQYKDLACSTHGAEHKYSETEDTSFSVKAIGNQFEITKKGETQLFIEDKLIIEYEFVEDQARYEKVLDQERERARKQLFDSSLSEKAPSDVRRKYAALKKDKKQASEGFWEVKSITPCSELLHHAVMNGTLPPLCQGPVWTFHPIQRSSKLEVSSAERQPPYEGVKTILWSLLGCLLFCIPLFWFAGLYKAIGFCFDNAKKHYARWSYVSNQIEVTPQLPAELLKHHTNVAILMSKMPYVPPKVAVQTCEKEDATVVLQHRSPETTVEVVTEPASEEKMTADGQRQFAL